jgi:hypothetical protein
MWDWNSGVEWRHQLQYPAAKCVRHIHVATWIETYSLR